MKFRTLLFLTVFALLRSAPATETPPAWSAEVEAALVAAGSNRTELVRALTEVPAEQREGMEFLIANMPPPDLSGLPADFLLTNVAAAYADMAKAPWASLVPQDVFLNDVLPYASLNEARDGSRAKVRELAHELVKGCRTPGEAALALNRELFKKVNVRYSTKRKKPDQSACESLESGVATCSGLSILLVEACRACGVPARIAGTPMWTNLRGNHTWVEVWDNGAWHFTGAAEPDKNGLDRGWFVEDASKADPDKAEFSIYASSFRKTGLSFPLVWNRRLDWVPAVNVTKRYTSAEVPAAPGVQVLVRVVERPDGPRVAARVTVKDNSGRCESFSGVSRDEEADLNNILPFTLVPDHDYSVQVESGGRTISRPLRTGAKSGDIVTIPLTD